MGTGRALFALTYTSRMEKIETKKPRYLLDFATPEEHERIHFEFAFAWREVFLTLQDFEDQLFELELKIRDVLCDEDCFNVG